MLLSLVVMTAVIGASTAWFYEPSILFAFHTHLYVPLDARPVQSCLIGNLTYVQYGGSLRKTLQVGGQSDSCQKLIVCMETVH